MERRGPPQASEGCAPERKVGGSIIRKIGEKVKGEEGSRVPVATSGNGPQEGLLPRVSARILAAHAVENIASMEISTSFFCNTFDASRISISRG